MASTESHTIQISGSTPTRPYFASEAITPGHLCDIASTGKIKKHAGAGLIHKNLFAVENGWVGKGINDAYAANDEVQALAPQKGDRVLAILKNGENAAIGSYLESAGDGTLRVVVNDTSANTIEVGCIVGWAVTACDMSGSNAVDPSGRLIVEII